jgi:hypothetical protein
MDERTTGCVLFEMNDGNSSAVRNALLEVDLTTKHRAELFLLCLRAMERVGEIGAYMRPESFAIPRGRLDFESGF